VYGTGRIIIRRHCITRGSRLESLLQEGNSESCQRRAEYDSASPSVIYRVF